jgi:hypothetical protein
MENETLLKQLVERAGLPEESALKALIIIAAFAKEKFPILGGGIDSYLREEFKQVHPDTLARVIED